MIIEVCEKSGLLHLKSKVREKESNRFEPFAMGTPVNQDIVWIP